MKRTYKRQVTRVIDIIDNAKRSGLYDFDKNKPYSVLIYKIVNDRELPIYKYFKTEAEAIAFRDKIKTELQKGLYNV